MPAVHGVVRWRIIDLCQWVWEEYEITVSKQTLSRELRALGYRKLSARPRHHAQMAGAIEASQKRMARPVRKQFSGDLIWPVCINVSGLWAQPWLRWRDPRVPVLIKLTASERHF